jgi:hypothetical protein
VARLAEQGGGGCNRSRSDRDADGVHSRLEHASNVLMPGEDVDHVGVRDAQHVHPRKPRVERAHGLLHTHDVLCLQMACHWAGGLPIGLRQQHADI